MKDALPSVFAGFFFVFQIIYGLLFAQNEGILHIEYLGVFFLLSDIFVMMPVLIFSKRGGAGKGKNLIHTKN